MKKQLYPRLVQIGTRTGAKNFGLFEAAKLEGKAVIASSLN
ncbi:MAG: hypothetical protein O6943_13915 [Bacteroidetes bacterium]|nr:hypothetical protein [Bacteroidota bacterium]